MVLLMKVADMLVGWDVPAVLLWLGIHSTKLLLFLFGMLKIICASTFMEPSDPGATVREWLWQGSQAAILFLAADICWVRSGTVRA